MYSQTAVARGRRIDFTTFFLCHWGWNSHSLPEVGVFTVIWHCSPKAANSESIREASAHGLRLFLFLHYSSYDWWTAPRGGTREALPAVSPVSQCQHCTGSRDMWNSLWETGKNAFLSWDSFFPLGFLWLSEKISSVSYSLHCTLWGRDHGQHNAMSLWIWRPCISLIFRVHWIELIILKLAVNISFFENLLYGRTWKYEICKAHSTCPYKVPECSGEMGDIHQKINNMTDSMYNKRTRNFWGRKNHLMEALTEPSTNSWKNKWMKWNRIKPP